MRLKERDLQLRELMDDPRCDPDMLRRTIKRFQIVNRLVSRWGSVYRSHLRTALTELNRPARMLDIGCGGGDVLRHVVRLAARDGFEIDALGIDPAPRALEVANRSDPVPGVSYSLAHAHTLVENDQKFDIVLSNHLLHHLSDPGFDLLVSDSQRLTTGLCIHSDIVRSQAAYLAYSAGSMLISPGSFLRTDGLRSIRRSYTVSELELRLPTNWSVEQTGNFRLLAVYDRFGQVAEFNKERP